MEGGSSGEGSGESSSAAADTAVGGYEGGSGAALGAEGIVSGEFGALGGAEGLGITTGSVLTIESSATQDGPVSDTEIAALEASFAAESATLSESDINAFEQIANGELLGPTDQITETTSPLESMALEDSSFSGDQEAQTESFLNQTNYTFLEGILGETVEFLPLSSQLEATDTEIDFYEPSVTLHETTSDHNIDRITEQSIDAIGELLVGNEVSNSFELVKPINPENDSEQEPINLLYEENVTEGKLSYGNAIFSTLLMQRNIDLQYASSIEYQVTADDQTHYHRVQFAEVGENLVLIQKTELAPDGALKSQIVTSPSLQEYLTTSGSERTSDQPVLEIQRTDKMPLYNLEWHVGASNIDMPSEIETPLRDEFKHNPWRHELTANPLIVQRIGKENPIKKELADDRKVRSKVDTVVEKLPDELKPTVVEVNVHTIRHAQYT